MPIVKVGGKYRYVNPNKYPRQATTKDSLGRTIYPNAELYGDKGIFLGDKTITTMEQVVVPTPTYLTAEQLREKGIVQEFNRGEFNGGVTPKTAYQEQSRYGGTIVVPSNQQEIPIVQPTNFEKINKFVQSKERVGYRDIEGNIIIKEKDLTNVQKPLSQIIGEKLDKTKLFQNIYIKHPEMEQGLFTTGGLSVGGKTVTINLKKTYKGITSFNKWLFFSPLMATGTFQQMEQQEATSQQGIYEYYTKNGIRYRKNLLTGKIEKATPTYEIIGEQTKPITPPTIVNGKLGRYIVKYGGKSYYVTETGKLIPVGTLQSIKPVITPVIKPITSSGFVQTGTPSMVGGTGLKNIPKQNGFFELTINLNRLPINLRYVGVVGGVTTWLSPQQTITKQQELVVPKETTITKTITSTISTSGLLSINKQKYSSSQPQISSINEIQIQSQPPIVITAQPSILKLRQPLKQPQGYKQVQKLKTPELFKLEKKGKQVVNYFKTSSSTKNIFESFLKRRGKDISLGKFGELGAAKTKFLKEVKSTLSASGFITKNKEVVPLKELNLGYEFTPSKKQPLFRAVQKRGLRLSSRGEVTEIMGAKKNKPKKIGRKVKWL
jgi:hypothetical protein